MRYGSLSYFRKGRTPDLSNCIKSIEDGLNGIAYEDDRQIRRIIAEMEFVKHRADERAEIEIREYRALQVLIEEVRRIAARIKRMAQAKDGEEAA